MGVNEMSQQVKAPATKSDDLSSIHKTQMVEEANWLPQVALWPAHVHCIFLYKIFNTKSWLPVAPA